MVNPKKKIEKSAEFTMVKLLAKELGGSLVYKAKKDKNFSFSALPLTSQKRGSANISQMRGHILKKISKRISEVKLNESDYQNYEIG